MVKPIIITNEETNDEYTLEFSRESVIFAENHGFVIEDFADKLMTRSSQLFWFAFRMHHPRMTQAMTDKILYEDLGGLTEELTDRLIELYNAPFDALVNTEGTTKNAKVTVKL